MRLVLDACVAIAAVRPHEPSHEASRARVAALLGGEGDFVVPALFEVEVAASLARAGEPPDAVRSYVETLVDAADKVVGVGPRAARRVRAIAIATKLRAADAFYAWVAVRERVPLCTLDHELLARAAGLCETMRP